MRRRTATATLSVQGAGKSVLIEALGCRLTAAGHRLAVLAIDPSSVRSGASPLGDKTRMVRLSADPNAFIRPSPSGLVLGGVARKTRATMHLLRGGEQPPVVTCSSLDGSGLDDIWRIVVERTREQERSGALKAQRRAGRELDVVAGR